MLGLHRVLARPVDGRRRNQKPVIPEQLGPRWWAIQRQRQHPAFTQRARLVLGNDRLEAVIAERFDDHRRRLVVLTIRQQEQEAYGATLDFLVKDQIDSPAAGACQRGVRLVTRVRCLAQALAVERYHHVDRGCFPSPGSLGRRHPTTAEGTRRQG
jgi:hypothetical protein